MIPPLTTPDPAETPSTGSGNVGRTSSWEMMLLRVAAAGGAVLAAASPSHAVAGTGGAVFDNHCLSTGHGSQARGATTSGAGFLGGNAALSPLHIVRQECGNSGMICSAPS